MRKIIVILMIFAIIIGMSGISVAKNDNKNDDKDNNHNDGNAGNGNDNKGHDNDDDNDDHDSDDGDSDDDNDDTNNGVSSSLHSNNIPSGGDFSFGTSDCNRMFILSEQLPDLRSERRMNDIAWEGYRMTPIQFFNKYCPLPEKEE